MISSRTAYRIALGLAAVVVAGGTTAWVLNAQTAPAKRVLQIARNTAAPGTTVRPADTRSAPSAVVPVLPAPAKQEASQAPKPGAEVLITRETYAYPGAGRRDPFVSLMNTEELRPLLGDLKLVAVAFDPTGRNSVAVLRDVTTSEQYRAKVGQELGRMRVASIHEKNVVFTIEEFGYSRQESLVMTDSTKVRTQ
jgi:hypothetical protein